jgi:hypothetical protein
MSALNQHSFVQGEYLNLGSMASTQRGTQGLSGSGATFGVQPANLSVIASEEELVNDICAPVGLRPSPDQEDLRKFVESTSNRDGLRIGELLIVKMVGHSD